MANRFLSNIRINDAYTLPASDGSSGQVITTDGSGNLSFVDPTSGAATTALSLNVTVKNVSGGSLSKGTIVHAHPSANPPSGNVIEVIAADYDDTTKMPAIGVLNETLANEAEGQAIMFGAVSGIDTSGFSIGDELWVGNNGAFTNTKPATSGQLIQKIAVVIKSHATAGLIKVFGAGRTNDVPLPLYIDNTNQRVGISVPNPSYKLDVSGDARVTTGLFLDRTTGLPNIKGVGEGNIVIDPLDASHKVYLSHYVAGDVILAGGGGNVGIGTSSPTYQLEIGGVSQPRIAIVTTSATGISQLNFGDNTDKDIGRLRYDHNGDFMAMWTNNQECMRITSAGNVGIGDVNPLQKLSVNGTASATVFYDYTNTSYYVNPDNTNNSLYLAGGAFFQNNVNIVKNNVGIITNYSSASIKATDAQLDIISSASGTWGSSINLVEGASSTANTNVWSIARQTSGVGNLLRFNFGTVNQHDNAEMFSISTGGNATAQGSVSATVFYDVTNTAYYVNPDNTGTSANFAGKVQASQVGVTNIVTNKVVKFNGSILDDSIITDDGTFIDVAGKVQADNAFVVQGIDTSNSQPSADHAFFSGYGIVGNRGTFYVTNAGTVQIGNGVNHNNNPTALFTSSSISLLRPTVISGSLEADGSFKLDDVHIRGIGAIGLNRDTSNGNIYDSNYSAFQLQHNRSIDAFELQAYNSSGTFQDRFVFTNTGKFGIGTTAPTYKLDVTGDIRGEKLRSTDIVLISKGASDTIQQGSSVYLDGGSGSSYTQLQQGVGRFTIWGYNGSAWGEKMTIRHSDGNVGIGTTSPNYKLEVYDGDVGARDLYLKSITNSNVRVQGVTTGDLDIYNNSTHRAKFSSTGDFWLYGNNNIKFSATGDATIGNYSGTGTLSFRTAAVQRMLIDSSGNVGVGLTSPIYTLDVNGTLGVRTGTIQTNGSTASFNFLAGSAAKGAKVGFLLASNSYSTTPASGVIEAQTDMRAPIYYDANNTNRYVNPSDAGRSIHVEGYITAGIGDSKGFEIGAGGAHITAVGLGDVVFQGAGQLRFGPSNWDWNQWGGIKYTGGTSPVLYIGGPASSVLTSNSAPPSTEINFTGTTFVISDTSFRAPIFYDSNDTSYYVHPDNLSHLNIVRVPGDIRGNGQQLILNAGESAAYATGQTGENVYVNAENGLQVNSSPDNWGSGWAGRYTVTINDSAGNSYFPGRVQASELYTSGKVIHTGDTDTWTEFNAADTWRVVVGGSQKLVVNSSSVSVSNATLSHQGVTLSSGDNIDQIHTFAMSFTLTALTWTDTGISYTDLPTGTYTVQVYVDDHNAGGQHYDEYYSGTMSWYAGNTNSTNSDEIVLHNAGHASGSSYIQLRTERHTSANGTHLMLQVKQNFNHSTALDGTDGKTMTFKFRRLL